MAFHRILRFTLIGGALVVGAAVFGRGLRGGAGASEPWKPGQVISTDELAKRLAKSAAAKPHIICVGPRVFYNEAHIPGAAYCGPGSKPEGLEKLKQCAQGLTHQREVVLYCGCCPWKDCPNIRPAFTLLRAMGFTKVKVLEIPQNFGQDWVNKGFPVARAR